MSTKSSEPDGRTSGEYPFLIGVSTVDITPPAGVTLAGYKPRISAGTAHPLRAEAVFCRGSGGEWLLIVCDIIGTTLSFTNEARAEISGRTGVKPGAILIAGTHTHSGPSVILVADDEQNDLDRRYFGTLKERLAAAAETAVKKAAPGRFEAAAAEVPGFSANRRILLPDGTWGNEWEDAEGRHPGFNDATMLVGAVTRPDGGREAVFVNFGCHPVTLGPSSLDISPDYPGYLKDALEQAGTARTAVFMLAGAGNINPAVCIKVGSAYPRLLGEALAGRATSVAGKLRPVGGNRVSVSSAAWSITRTRDAFKFRGQAAPYAGDTMKTELTAFAAGDAAFLGIPGELFNEYNGMIRKSSPFAFTFIVTLAGDYPGYFPTDRAQEEGAYETKMAPASELERTLLSETGRVLEKLGRTGVQAREQER